MSVLFSFCTCQALGVIITLFIGIVTYFKWSYSYWKMRNLPYLEPSSWHGNMENPFSQKTYIGVWLKQNCYDYFKQKGVKHAGIFNFTAPVYLPIHPDYIKNIMQSDFQHFIDRGIYYNENIDPLSANIFALGGQKWKNIRAKLTPVFTSGKMKTMFDILVQCTLPLKEEVGKLAVKKRAIDIKNMAMRYTVDVIGSSFFGLACKSFESEDTDLRKFGMAILKRPLWDQSLQLICFSKPWIGHLFNIRAFPKDSSDFFFKIIKDAVKYRKENNVKRNDVLQLLIGLLDSNEGLQLTIEEMAAQCVGFFVAGFETSSTTMTFCLYEIAKSPDIQQKMRDEINKVLPKHNGKLTYDSMSDLKYMTQVIDETLRKYPPLSQLTRRCIKDYQVPNTDVVIEKGTAVFISILGLHHDPEYFPNPECFDPERFSEKNKARRHQFTYIPFGEGPRLCIAMRFGMMQTKVGLTALLQNYIFSLNEKTPKTLTFDPKNFLLDTIETIVLDSRPVK